MLNIPIRDLIPENSLCRNCDYILRMCGNCIVKQHLENGYNVVDECANFMDTNPIGARPC